MRLLKNTFFFKLYHYNRKLFFLFSFFFLFTLIGNLLGDEVTPFFVFGMYSEKEQQVREYEILKIIINDNVDLAKYNFSTYQKHFVLDPLSFYKLIRENNNVDPTITFLQEKLKGHYKIIKPIEKRLFNGHSEIENFMPWYQRFLEKTIGFPVSSITVSNQFVHYTQDQKVVIDSTHLLERWGK